MVLLRVLTYPSKCHVHHPAVLYLRLFLTLVFSGPNDFSSWKTRLQKSKKLPSGITFEKGEAMNAAASDSLSLPSLQLRRYDALSSRHSTPSDPDHRRTKSTRAKKRGVPRTRVGWWSHLGYEPMVPDVTPAAVNDSPLQLPPIYHAANAIRIKSLVGPEPVDLMKENLPLSRLDAVTPLSEVLPYLCDRPPSTRYLQIDTQAVGFPPIGGEFEPLFCSLAIYHVETIASSGHVTDAPIPDLRRCGKITETLYFDYVSDESVAQMCVDALWPYMSPDGVVSSDRKGCLQGTRCGVFPLPSNFHIANLYAVLVVEKIYSSDVDLDIYLKGQKDPVDLERLRVQASTSSREFRNITRPFAFGVAPLLQVFGPDNPSTAMSRAVQIPLFRLRACKIERQIIDHIMVMLYPK